MSKRVFKPRLHTSITIDRWEWTRSKGLLVIYRDGVCWRSEYTLRELLQIERPQEVEP